jgi:hypothetical protein
MKNLREGEGICKPVLQKTTKELSNSVAKKKQAICFSFYLFFFAVLGFELRVSHLLGKGSIT